MTKQAQQAVFAAELPERGQPLAGGVFVTRYWLNGRERALILLPDELAGQWGEYGVEIKSAGSYSDGEGNTRAMAEAGSVIAVKALELDGFIPSCLEGQLLMAAKADGLVELRDDRYHWLSTQRSADDAYSMDFEDGWLSYYGKDNERLARPVRRFMCCSLPVRGSRPGLLRLPAQQAELRECPAVREGHGDQLAGAVRRPDCRQHGQMQLQQAGTKEQAFCGTWYRCNHCTHSVLLASPQLRAITTAA